jgi:hypothetical protein
MLDDAKLTPKSEPKYLFESLKILSKELTKETLKNKKLNEFANFEIEKAINILTNAKNQGVDSLAEILSGKKILIKILTQKKNLVVRDKKFRLCDFSQKNRKVLFYVLCKKNSRKLALGGYYDPPNGCFVLCYLYNCY